MKSEADRVKSYLSDLVRRHHKGQPESDVLLREQVLFAILDASSEVISDAIKSVPTARIFSRDDLRSFLAKVVADVILKAGKHVLLTKGRK